MSLFVRTIVRKRDGAELTEGEIADFVRGITEGTISDEQAAAFLMAVCCRGMTTSETASLTFAMMRSGETWDLAAHGFVGDKHSTGGVGDKVTLVLAPLLAAVGVKSGMMSGRGLGHTGGTLDKLEAIPGFATSLPRAGFDRLLETAAERGARMEWWREGRFGLFIHWGLSSVKAMNISWPMIPGRILAKERVTEPPERERIIREADWNLKGKKPEPFASKWGASFGDQQVRLKTRDEWQSLVPRYYL